MGSLCDQEAIRAASFSWVADLATGNLGISYTYDVGEELGNLSNLTPDRYKYLSVENQYAI